MHPPGADTVIARYGEVGTKSRPVRGRMVEQLCANLRALLADRGLAGGVEHRSARVVIETGGDVDAVADAAADAFGVETASAALRVAPTVDAITDALADTARAVYGGEPFAVRARRGGDGHPFTSEDLEREGGSAVWEAVADEYDPAVDLDDPGLTFHVDCRPREAFVFLGKRDGPGGLPLGTQEPVVALLSGGIDSPVAAHELMTRGCPVVPLYLDLGAYGGPDHRARAEEVTRTLAGRAPNFDTRLRVAPAGGVVADLVAAMDRGRMLAFRRFMLRVAAELARAEGAVAVATGESVGQKSSQTAANLRVTGAATDLPVHRPLLTADKTDIVDRAREIGTFSDSTLPAGCDRFAPSRPMTAADLDALRELEPDDLFDRAAAVARDVEIAGAAEA